MKHNKNKTNKTDIGKIYDAANLLNIIWCNPGEFHIGCKPVGIRKSFLFILHKK